MSGHFQPLSPARVLRKLKKLSLPKDGQQYMINRNPRNLEKLRVAYKPNGYLLEKPGRSYWHKLELNITNRYVTAEVKHFENGPVVTASSSEWAVKKQLFKTNDASAYINTARVFAQRCLRSGITEIMCKIEATPGGKVEKFLKVVEENGIALKEPEQLKPILPWDQYRPEKPWEVPESEATLAPKK